jgi:hypothetical protein
VVITGPALIAGAAGDGRIHNYQISRFETCYLFSRVLHDCTAFMAHTKGETHNLVSDPSLSVIVEIGTADAGPDDPEQYIGRMLQRGGRLFHDFNFPDSRKYHSFHEALLLSR